MAELFEDHGGYFSGVNPDVLQKSIEWSNAIHGDPSIDNVSSMMHDARRYLIDNSQVEPHSAALAAAEIVRGSLVRVIAHRFAMGMAPLATALLEGDNQIIRDALQDPALGAIKSPTAGVRTDFARVWFGDDARLLATTGLLMQSVARETIDKLPNGIRAGTLRAGIWVGHATNNLIEYRGLQEEQATQVVNGKWGHAPRNHFTIKNLSERGNFQKRFLLTGGMKMDAGTFLMHNTEAATEHVLAFLTDVFHGFPSEATTDEKLDTVMAGLHMCSLSAFMGNMQNAEAEYKDRYVESASEGPGRYLSRREPLILVVSDGQSYRIVPNPKSDYVKASRQKRQRCPGPDALIPLGTEVDASRQLRAAMKSVVTKSGHYNDETLAMLDRDFSEIDVIAGLGAAVAHSLIELGFVTLDQQDVSRQLRPAGKATSTGAYILVG